MGVLSISLLLAGRWQGHGYRTNGYISTHTPLAGRDWNYRTSSALSVISTHTPLAGRDLIFAAKNIREAISTHTPLAGRDSAAL